jgi:energy-coupling factor transport system ATP-binding protein
MDEAALAERILVFDQGRLALDGPPVEIFADPARLTAFRLDLPPAARVAGALRAVLPNLPKNLLTMPDLLAALPAYNGISHAATFSDGPVPRAQGMLPPIIEVTDLGFSYMIGSPLEQRALHNADLRVEQGQAHGLLGMTGSGKSTLMQHLNALLHPQQGSVRVGKFDLTDPQVDRREVVRHVGLVFQNPENQFFEYFVGDEISYGPRQLKIEEPLAERVRWAMQQVDLDFDEFKDRPLRSLSGGERRKVALASTLALKPSILLLDEPTAGLDPYSRRELLNKLAEMRRSGMTILLSSHRMEDLSVLTSALTVYHRGDDVLSGPTARIFSQPEALQPYGLVPPVAVQTAAVMRAKGWPLPEDVLTSSMLREAVASIVQETAE